MSSAVCLSLVANLRCSGLRPQQAIVILAPPAIEALLVSFLLYTQRNKGRKHYLLLFDSYIFLALCIVDFISKANNAISTSLEVFSVVDRVIGGLSGFPIVLYTLFLYLFARRHFISILPTRFQWSVKVLLTLLIPVILVLVELGSLLGFSYITLSTSPLELAVRYNSPLAKTMWTLLNSAGLVLLVLYQFVCFCLSVFRIFRFFHHATDTDSPRIDSKRGRSNKQPTRLRGVGWIAAGIKIGAIEVILGFVPNGFGMSLSRRLLRLVGHFMLAWGVYQGIDDSPGPGAPMFRVGSIDSIEGLPPRRIPVNQGALRTLIGAPMTATFAKMSPTATAFHTRKKVPDAMAGIKAFDTSFVDEKAGRTGDPGPSREVVQSTVIPALMIRNAAVPSISAPGGPFGFGRNSYIEKASNALEGDGRKQANYPQRPSFPKLKQAEKRVTVAYDGRQVPVLDIRFSSQLLPDAGKLIKRIGHSPSNSVDLSSSEDSTNQRPALNRSRTAPVVTAARSRSMPPSKLSDTPEEVEPSQIEDAITASSTEELSPAQASSSKELLPMSRTANGGARGRSRSTSNKSAQPTLYNPFADPPNTNQSFSTQDSSSNNARKRQDSSVSDDSLTAIRQLSTKFPPLPAGAVPGGSPTRNIPRKQVPSDLPESATTVRTRPARQRSNSTPRLRSQPGNGMNPDSQSIDSRRLATQDMSPRTSLDQDVATRTKRRINAHLKKTSSSSSLVAPGEYIMQGGSPVRSGQQWAVSSPNETTVTSAATSLFSVRGRGVDPRLRASARAELADDMLTSPITVFSTDSIYSADETYSCPTKDDRPMGRIARRALGIEQFLGEEKEKWEASQDGHGDLKQSKGSSQPIPRAQARIDAPLSELPIASISRVRPRSNVDVVLMKPRPPKRGMTVDDPDAREAFAAAWRTVVPNVASPSVADLKTVNSVSVKQTPAPSRHRAVFSAESMQSMRVSEGHLGPLSPRSTTTPRPSQRARAGSGASRSKDGPESDREYVKNARLRKVASVDSEVY